MGIKDIFTKNKLKPFLSFSQKGNIWRMHFSPSDILVCETRDLNSRETYFFSLNYKTKQVFLTNFQLDEKWWIAIESINDNTIFFNKFKTPELPEHLGIIAVDFKTGKIKWTNTELTFLFADSPDVYAYKEHFEREIYYKLNDDTGEIIETYEDEKIADSLLELKSFNEEKIFSGFIYPNIYIEGNYVEPAAENYLMQKFKDVKYLGEIEYALSGDFMIYNFHADLGVNVKDINSRNLANHLEIYNFKTGKVIHDEVLNSEAVNYVPDSFFVKEGFLFYIKEKKELISIDLNKIS